MDPKIADLVSANLVTSVVSFILVSATVLALPVSLLLLRRYRTVVAREISRAIADQAAAVEERVAGRADPPSLPLTITVAGSGQSVPDSPDAEQFFTQVRRRTRASAWVYAIAGAAFAAVMTYAWLIVTKDEARVGTKISMLFWSYFWPTVLAFALVIATSSRACLAALGSYGVVWVALGAWALSRNPDLTVWQLTVYWLVAAAPPTLMLAPVMFPRVRPVGPLVLPMVALLLACIFALVAFRAVVVVGVRVAKRLTPSPRPVNLLLLRVFALGRRSERLFSVLQRAWLRQGSMAMIAGPDLAASVIEPHEVVQFMLGNLQEQFVGNAAQLDDRFRSMDRLALPDGRYRINEFYCHANVWQRVMQRLVTESDVVLMDLRSFSRENQGCVFELAQLIDIFDLRRILFVIDPTTDRAFLEEALKDLWGRARATSPNRSLPAPTATLFHCEQSAERVLDPLLRQLLAFSQSTPRLGR